MLLTFWVEFVMVWLQQLRLFVLFCVRINEQQQVITAPYRHVQDSSGGRYSNSDPEVAATAGVAVL